MTQDRARAGDTPTTDDLVDLAVAVLVGEGRPREDIHRSELVGPLNRIAVAARGLADLIALMPARDDGRRSPRRWGQPRVVGDEQDPQVPADEPSER